MDMSVISNFTQVTYTNTKLLNNNYLLAGKERDACPEKGLAHNVVVQSVSHLANQGYRVYTDSFYTSPDLFCDLHKMGFEACGTVRSNRKGITPKFQQHKLTLGNLHYKIITINFLSFSCR